MRIDPFGSVASALDTGESAGTPPAAASAAPPAEPQDTASLSENSVTLVTLSSQAMAMAAQMEQRVDALRQAVNTGEYTLEPSQIAEAMLSDGM